MGRPDPDNMGTSPGKSGRTGEDNSRAKGSLFYITDYGTGRRIKGLTNKAHLDGL